MASYVNGAGAQHFFATTFSTSLDTPAIAVTAGNFLSVVLRIGAGCLPSEVTISDTAGNSWRLDGYVTDATDPTSRFFAWSAPNCLGHPANVVHVTYPSRAFTAVNISQYAGMPATVGADVVSKAQAAGGTTIAITPGSAYADQLVILAVDLTNSGHSTPSPAAFTLLYQSTYDGGAPVGVGSHDVWFNTNSSRQFDGAVTITNTFTGGFATSSKSALCLIYRQSPAGVPVPLPSAQLIPCTPQAQVNNGGKGQAGCNVGGVGFTRSYFGPYGTVPQHADPPVGESLINKQGRGIEAWAELRHVEYPSGDVTIYRRAFVELGDRAEYEGGRKPRGLLSVGEIENAIGNEQGGFEAATLELEFSDEDDRLFHDLADDQELEGDEIYIKQASDEAREGIEQ